MKIILAGLILIIIRLGLAINQQIVEEKYRGTINSVSKPGQGTELTITLPLENNQG